MLLLLLLFSALVAAQNALEVTATSVYDDAQKRLRITGNIINNPNTADNGQFTKLWFDWDNDPSTTNTFQGASVLETTPGLTINTEGLPVFANGDAFYMDIDAGLSAAPFGFDFVLSLPNAQV